jgi:hypothetical protein
MLPVDHASDYSCLEEALPEFLRGVASLSATELLAGERGVVSLLVAILSLLNDLYMTKNIINICGGEGRERGRVRYGSKSWTKARARQLQEGGNTCAMEKRHQMDACSCRLGVMNEAMPGPSA